MTHAVMTIASIGCALACAVLVAAELGRWRRVRIVSKCIASAAFILIGGAAYAAGGGDFARWIVIGLVLGALGDVALLGKSDAAFLAGLGSFLLGHLAYVVAAAQLASPADWPAAAGPLAAAPLVVGAAVLVWLWSRLGSMKVPVIAYVLTIAAMVIGALAGPNRLFTVGAVLFFASDLAVARDKFVGADVINRVWGLPCYYAGQILIAWSSAP
jgi:uncharacterized membrane protein YhhN